MVGSFCRKLRFQAVSATSHGNIRRKRLLFLGAGQILPPYILRTSLQNPRSLLLSRRSLLLSRLLELLRLRLAALTSEGVGGRRIFSK